MRNKLDESLIAPLPPFRKLGRAQIREILDQAAPRRYEAGTAVFREGGQAERFYLLLDGTIRVIRTPSGGAQVIALHISSGSLFGIAPALGRDSYPATAVAAVECLALSWPASVWQSFVSRYDGFATETYRTVGERIGEMNNRIVELATLQVEQRVVNALLRLAKQSGRQVEEGILIDIPVTRQDISDMTGTTIHTVSRLLAAWEKQGIIGGGRGCIVVRAPHQLVLLKDRAA
jgi:CRP/FNR family transcriptional regulator, nitrogen oxide reductase regulator